MKFSKVRLRWYVPALYGISFLLAIALWATLYFNFSIFP